VMAKQYAKGASPLPPRSAPERNPVRTGSARPGHTALKR
jgi:hypothetical protein